MKVTMTGAGCRPCHRDLSRRGRQRRAVSRIDARKIDVLKQGGVPIHELARCMRSGNVAAGRLHFTTDQTPRPCGALQFIAVGTPPDEDGSADMKYVPQPRAPSAAG